MKINSPQVSDPSRKSALNNTITLKENAHSAGITPFLEIRKCCKNNEILTMLMNYSCSNFGNRAVAAARAQMMHLNNSWECIDSLE